MALRSEWVLCSPKYNPELAICPFAVRRTADASCFLLGIVIRALSRPSGFSSARGLFGAFRCNGLGSRRQIWYSGNLLAWAGTLRIVKAANADFTSRCKISARMLLYLSLRYPYQLRVRKLKRPPPTSRDDRHAPGNRRIRYRGRPGCGMGSALRFVGWWWCRGGGAGGRVCVCGGGYSRAICRAISAPYPRTWRNPSLPALRTRKEVPA